MKPLRFPRVVERLAILAGSLEWKNRIWIFPDRQTLRVNHTPWTLLPTKKASNLFAIKLGRESTRKHQASYVVITHQFIAILISDSMIPEYNSSKTSLWSG
jgi:hypothetical protein